MDIQKLILHILVERVLLDTQFNKLRSIIQLGIQYSAVVLDIHNVSYRYSKIDILKYINRDRFLWVLFYYFIPIYKYQYINFWISIFLFTTNIQTYSIILDIHYLIYSYPQLKFWLSKKKYVSISSADKVRVAISERL